MPNARTRQLLHRHAVAFVSPTALLLANFGMKRLPSCANAKSLAKVRELQGAGRLGPDVPTNVYFFFGAAPGSRTVASRRFPGGR